MNYHLFDFNRSVQATGQSALDDFRPTATIEHLRGDPIAPSYMPQLAEYLLRLTFTVKFVSSPDELQGAARLAEKTIIAAVYSELLPELHRLLLSISSGDRGSSMEITGSLIDRIVNGELGIGPPRRVG